jgi:hypothetical protein
VTGGTSTGAPGLPRCHTSDVSGRFAAIPGSAGAGNITYDVVLINTSSHTCTVYGHPGMLLLDTHHVPLPTHVEWGTTTPNRVITLAPGHSAAASARFSPDVPGTGDNTASSSGTTCEPTAHYTEITPPDETTHLVVAVGPPTPVCERGTMSVSAFMADSQGPNG